MRAYVTSLVGSNQERLGNAPLHPGQLFTEEDTGLLYCVNEAGDDYIGPLNMAGGGGGTAGRLAYYTDPNTLAASDIIENVTGNQLQITAALTAQRSLTLPDADVTVTGGGTLALGGFTLTVPATGTGVLGTGAASQVVYWSDVNTVAGDAGLTYNAATDTLSLANSLTFTGATGVNDITVPDNLADAFSLDDAGGLNFLQVVSTDAQPVVWWNPAGADVDFHVSATGAANAFFVRGSDGKVGVGTVAPAAILDVVGTSADGARFATTSNTHFAYNTFSGNGTLGYIYAFSPGYGGSGRYVPASFLIDTPATGGLGLSATHPSGGEIRFYTAGNNERGYVDVNGNWGIGTIAADRLFHVEKADAVTNSVVYVQRLSHITSATAVAGFGAGIEFELEENDGNPHVAGLLECLWTDAGEGANADADFVFKLMLDDAAAAEVARMVSNGDLKIQNDYWAQGNLGLTGTMTLDDGVNWRATLTFVGSILTGQSTGASVGALAQWAAA